MGASNEEALLGGLSAAHLRGRVSALLVRRRALVEVRVLGIDPRRRAVGAVLLFFDRARRGLRAFFHEASCPRGAAARTVRRTRLGSTNSTTCATASSGDSQYSTFSTATATRRIS